MKKFLIIICLLIPSVIRAAAPLHIEIKGISGDPLKNIQARLAVIQKSYGKEITEDNYQDFSSHAPKNIRRALEPFGYFKPEIKTLLINHTIQLTINPGPVMKIADIDLDIIGPGKSDPELKKLLSQFPLKTGQPFSAEQYEHAKELLFQTAHNQGYIKATLDKKELRINLKEYRASIILHLNTGPRFYFGHITFKPSEAYSQSFLNRFATFDENEPFTNQKLLKFQQDLSGGRFFQEVNATPRLEHTEDYHVPVDVSVVAPKSQRYDAGIGYGTFTGPRFTMGADFRRVTKTGNRFKTQLKLSSVLSGLAATYYIPGKNPLTDQYTLGVNTQYFAPKSGTSFSQTLSVAHVKMFKEWQRTVSLNYLNERYRKIDNPTHQSQILYPSLNFSRIKADNLIFPRSGNMINFTVQGASEDAFSKTSFFQSELKGKTIYSPTTNSRAIFRGDIGYTVVKDLRKLPFSLNYFAGGMGSVRGYPYSSIGPGKYIEVASAEFQHKIIGDWSGAVFYDVGNASNTFNGHFSKGTGVGVIYNSFIGPIQVYAAKALSNANKPMSIEFSIGPDF